MYTIECFIGGEASWQFMASFNSLIDAIWAARLQASLGRRPCRIVFGDAEIRVEIDGKLSGIVATPTTASRYES